MPPKALWKLTIDPRGKKDTSTDPFHFCLEKSIIGIGWWLPRVPKDKKDATTLFREEHKENITAFNIMVHRMEKNDHAWIYGKQKYYICNITSDWRHENGDSWGDNDIHNIRSATWKEIPIELVPGCVKRSLTMFGTAHKIKANAPMLKYSDWLFNNNTLTMSSIRSRIEIDSIANKITSNDSDWLFSIIDANETEDLIGLYLQKDMKWCMIKSSAYKSQRRFECEYRRVSGSVGETAFMQVKSGHSITLDCEDYAKDVDSTTYIYLFSTGNTPYKNFGAHRNVIAINKDSIVKFAAANARLLPLPILLKLSIA